jgi:hypothetical protein
VVTVLSSHPGHNHQRARRLLIRSSVDHSSALPPALPLENQDDPDECGGQEKHELRPEKDCLGRLLDACQNPEPFHARLGRAHPRKEMALPEKWAAAPGSHLVDTP